MRAGEDTACCLESETLGFALLVPDRVGQVAPELQTRHLRWSPFLHATLLFTFSLEGTLASPFPSPASLLLLWMRSRNVHSLVG